MQCAQFPPAGFMASERGIAENAGHSSRRLAECDSNMPAHRFGISVSS